MKIKVTGTLARYPATRKVKNKDTDTLGLGILATATGDENKFI